VFFARDEVPTAVLRFAVVFACKAACPIATFSVPVVLTFNDSKPAAIF